MKRFMPLILIFLLLLTSLPALAYEDPTFIHDNLKCVVIESANVKSINIIKYLGPGGNVVIPTTIYSDKDKEDIEVRTIGPDAFKDKKLTGLTLPGNLEIIAEGAFQNNKIPYLSLPASVYSVSTNAFNNAGLENIDLWPGSLSDLDNIGEGAFANNKLRSIFLPDGFGHTDHDFFKGNEAGLILYGGPSSKAKAIADKYGYIYKDKPSGYVTQDPHIYFYDDDGHRYREWMKLEEGDIFFDKDVGNKIFGFSYIYDDDLFYFDEEGIFQSGHFITNGEVYRHDGKDRYDTAVQASYSNIRSANTVVLALGNNFPDALAGASLADKGLPIFLTRSDSVPKEIQDRISSLQTKKIYVLGGPGAIKESLVKALRNQGYEVIRLGGKDRYETAAKIAKEVAPKGSKEVFLVSGTSFPDALSIGPVASRYSQPIILTRKNEIPDDSLKALKDLGVKVITIVGGHEVISEDVNNQLKKLGYSTFRIAGMDRYETSYIIANQYDFFNKTKENNEVIVAAGNGNKFADALVASYMGNLRSAPILLTNQNKITKDILDYIANKSLPNIKKTGVHIMGGTAAVSEGVENGIKNVLK